MKVRHMMILVSTLVLTILLGIDVQAQIIGTKGDYIWEMGYLSKSMIPKENLFEIDFNTDPPNARYVDRILQMSRTTTSYCNDEGRLLAYSNGIHIVDSIHQIMEGGDSVSFNNYFSIFKATMQSGYRLTRNNIILPLRQNRLIYLQQLIFFEPELIVWFKDLIAAEIDMSQNIAGKVISKQILLSGSYESLSMNACRHANGKDWWILLQKKGTADFYSYLLDEVGLHLKQQMIFVIPDYLSYDLGFIFSPNGNKCVKLAGSYGALMFDFDRETGMLSNMFDLQTSFLPNGYGDVAFSRSSRFLYTFNNGFVLQYDLMNPDSTAILATRDTIAKYDPINYPKANFVQGNLAPDGKIYITASSGWDTLSVINYPDRKGKACGFSYDGFGLPARNSPGSIPNYPHYRLGPIDGSPSDILGIDNLVKAKFRVDNDSSFYNKREFIDLSFLEPTSWSWDFGDGSFSSDTSPVHWFPSNGSYGICLTVSNANGSDTYCRVINIGPVSAKNLIKDYGLSLSPNPCQDYIILNVRENYPKALQMSISDTQGKMIKSNRIFLNNGFTTIDVSGIPAGSYYMTLSDSEGNQEVMQFVKQ